MAKRKAAAAAVEGEVPANTKKLRPQRANYVQYKCNLHHFWTTITEKRTEIERKAWDRLKKCPFWGFIKPFYDGKITKDQVSKSDELISRLVSFYDPNNAWFVFGDRRIHTTATDVRRTFGISNQGKHIDVSGRQSKGKTDFIKRNFSECERVCKTDIDATLKKAMTKGDKEDVAALLIMGLLASFLLCSSGASLSWNIINLITPDLATLKQYNWAEAVADSLAKGLSRIDKDKPTALSGCVMLLMYWVCDKTAIMTPIPGRETETPTFVKWGLPKLHASMLEISDEYFESLFKKENQEVEVERLTPTPTFGEWVFPSSQEMKEELSRTKDAMESILSSIEPATSKMKEDGIIDAQKTVVELKKLKLKLEDRITELGERIEEFEGDIRTEVQGAAQDDEEFKAGTSAAEVQPSQENVEEHNQEVQNEEDFLDQYGTNDAEADELREQALDKDTEVQIQTSEAEEKGEEGPDVNADKDTEVQYQTQEAEGKGEEGPDVNAGNATEIQNQTQEAEEKGNKLEMMVNTGEENKDASTIIKECLDSIAEEGEKGKKKKEKRPEHRSVMNLRSRDERKENKDKENFIFTTPKEIKGKKALYRPPPKVSYKLKGVNCRTKHWQDLSLKEQAMLHTFWEQPPEDAKLWDGGLIGSVSRRDVRDLIEGNAIKSNVLDAYMEIVQQHLSQKGNDTKGILTTYVLGILTGEGEHSQSLYKKFVYEPIIDMFGRCDDIFIPLILTTDFHYTMLHFNKNCNQWIHYNPMRARRPETTKGFKNAVEVSNKVMKLLFGFQDHIKRSGKKNLSNNATKTLGWIKENEETEGLSVIEDMDCVQQNQNSMDCGVYVASYIELLANNIDLEEEFRKDRAMNMRRRMIERFLTNENSWNHLMGEV